MQGTQKRKADSQTGMAGVVAGVQDKKTWEDFFTYVDEGQYMMLPWKPCPKFRKSSSAYAQDPQPMMRMCIGLSKMKGIIEALTAIRQETQHAKKTRSAVPHDDAPKHLRICGGWHDWEADFDYNGEANKAHRIQEAVWLQGQLGAGIGMCAELESLYLQNMEWYVHKNKKGVKLFFVNLRECAKLTKLVLINNSCGGCFLDAIIPEVLQLPLRHLELRGNRLYRADLFPVKEEEEARETAFVELLGTLGKCKTLVKLSLADMNLVFGAADDMTTRMVLRLMQELPLLTALSLCQNEMDPAARAALEAAKPAKLQITFTF